MFPSPTGVNYYEYGYQVKKGSKAVIKSFRPQQGLTIMNSRQSIQCGLNVCFRPQQGLTIMNQKKRRNVYKNLFPSPTGVNYYEFRTIENKSLEICMFPSPTGVNYYEFRRLTNVLNEMSFRPQQGLTIMNL